MPVTVENLTGAGSNIATERAAKSPPDGYTLIMGGNSALVVSPSLYDKLPYDRVVLWQARQALEKFSPVRRDGL